MRMPPPRGELSEWLGQRLTGRAPVRGLPRPTADASSAHTDDDLQLALWCCYELHYRGFDDVHAEAEWNPEVLRFRSGLEHRWTECLQLLCSSREVHPSMPAAQLLRQVIDANDAPSLSRYVQRHARSLVNRAFGTDYPGTLAVRTAWYDKAGGYDGDVLFENLELIRTLRVAGADVRAARDIMVRRRPPDAPRVLGAARSAGVRQPGTARPSRRRVGVATGGRAHWRCTARALPLPRHC